MPLEAGKQANSIIDAMYEGYISLSVVGRSLVMPHGRHVCVLLTLVILNVRHVHLDLHIWVSLKGRATCIWSFVCGFAFSITIRCAKFKLLLYVIIFL